MLSNNDILMLQIITGIENKSYFEHEILPKLTIYHTSSTVVYCCEQIRLKPFAAKIDNEYKKIGALGLCMHCDKIFLLKAKESEGVEC